MAILALVVTILTGAVTGVWVLGSRLAAIDSSVARMGAQIEAIGDTVEELRRKR